MSLTVLQWNCRSISNKLDHLRCPPFSSADILVFQETFLSSGKASPLLNRSLYRVDRQDRPGGGLLIAVKFSIASHPLDLFTSQSGNELMGVKIYLPSGPLNIINFYSTSGQVSQDLTRLASTIHGPSLICGDFNSHHPLWGATSSSRHSEDFAQWITNSTFCLLDSSSPTHVAPSGNLSTLDLSLCSCDLMTKTTRQVHDDLYESDHYPISISIALSPPPLTPQLRFRWKNINSEVNNTLSHRTSITYSDFMRITRSAMAHNQFRPAPRCSSFPPWWSPQCHNLLQQKRFFHKKAKSLVSLDYWSKYKRTAAKLRQVIKDTKRHFWDSVCSNASDPRILYKTLQKFQRRSSPSPDSHLILQTDEDLITEAAPQSELFANHFSTAAAHESIPLDFSGEDASFLNPPFSLVELHDGICKTKVPTPGEDKISAKFFKDLNDHSKALLLQIYNHSWSTGDIPDEWKSATILPICKPGKPQRQISSYRPIALTSVMCKIFERMIIQRIYNHLTKHKLIDPRILGFLPFRDCQSALAILHADITRARAEKKLIIGISLDIQAAYDSVYIDGLALKCAQVGIIGNALRWIYNLPKGRQIKVTWRNHLSTSRSLERGVPQGSVLSPVLFAIFMADFFEALPPHVQGLIYADDVFIYSSSSTIDNCKALRSIAMWCDYWKLQIRADKCHAINLSRRKADCGFNFAINYGLIEWVDNLKFLGFFFSQRGNFNTHANYIRRKALKKMNIIKAFSTKRYGARSHHLVALVQATVCSLFHHGAAILGNASATTLKHLGVIQTSALRIALGLPQWVPNIILRHHAGVPLLSDHVRHLGLSFWIKHSSLRSWSPLWPSLLVSSEDNDTNAASLFPYLRDYLDQHHINLDHLIPLHFPLPPSPDAISYQVNDYPFQRTDLAEKCISSFFSEFLQSLTVPTNIIATDASKSPEATSIAACSSSGQFAYRINSINSIFTAESLAICTALDELATDSRPLLLLTDSLSSVTALQHISTSSPKVTLWLHNKLQISATYASNIKVVWVPGHRGIPLNEKADRLAKSVSDHDVLLDWISPEDCIAHSKKEIYAETGFQYTNSKYLISHGTIPSIRTTHSWARNRREDVICSRLVCRMFVTPATLFRFHLATSNLCATCQVPDNIEHSILFCKNYTQQRHSCWPNFDPNSPPFSSLSEIISHFCSSPTFRSACIKFLKTTLSQ